MGNMLNMTTILYTAFRLAPFILVSFFTLSSVLNQDFKGIIYLAGLLISCFISVAVGNTSSIISEIPTDMNETCNSLTLSDSGKLSNLPLSMNVFSYTFFYLVYVIAKYDKKYKLAANNIPTLILFPLLILGDAYWNMKYNCSGLKSILFSFLIGSVVGVLWAYMIDSLKIAKLQYFSGISNKEICSQPTKQLFRCKTVG